MSAELIMQLVGGAGFLAGVAGVLRYVQDRTRIRAEVAKDAAQAYRQFIESQPWPSNSPPSWWTTSATRRCAHAGASSTPGARGATGRRTCA